MLEIIQIDICGDFFTPHLNGQRYFIAFIDDHLRYMYLHLLNHMDDTLDALKIYQVEAEKQNERKIKIIKLEWVENIMNSTQYRDKCQVHLLIF